MTKKVGTKDLKGQRRGGFYWQETGPHLSVTEILKVIAKPALQYWFGREVYYAMVTDPTLNEKEALAAPFRTSKTAMTRGTNVHSMVEFYKHTKKHLKSVAPEYKGYADAFYSFIETHKVEVIENERSIFSKKHKYGGTLDLLVKIGDMKYPLVGDIKTGKSIYDEAFIQTSAYQNALAEDGIETSGVCVILLMPDGGFKFEMKTNTKPYLDAFLAAKTIYEALNRDKLLKVGYLESEVSQ